MKIITFEDIQRLGISPKQCVEWVEEVLKLKYFTKLPHKISLTFNEGANFFNTMPCLIPSIERFAVKEVSRYPNRNPSISGEILLYSSVDGSLLSLMDADWITAMRTGAVAASSIKHLRQIKSKNFAFLGLGNTARATLLCLLHNEPDFNFNIKLLKYKNHAELFIERFEEFQNVSFEIIENNKDLITDTDVIISCVTVADGLVGEDQWFKPGVLVVPIHTRGFQNCDLFFDKVYADDTDHVSGFKYFNQFKKYDEFANVLLKNNTGRENSKERILAYNIGIALHDVYFASKIYDLINIATKEEVSLRNTLPKFWV